MVPSSISKAYNNTILTLLNCCNRPDFKAASRPLPPPLSTTNLTAACHCMIFYNLPNFQINRLQRIKSCLDHTLSNLVGSHTQPCSQIYTPLLDKFQTIFRFLSSKRRVLVHYGCYFCSWIKWKLVRPLSGMHWLVSFGDVLISFEIEISISEDDDSRQIIHHRSVIDIFYVGLMLV